jgi:microcystin-dependent protein
VARSPQINMFLNANASVTMSTQFLGNTGGGQPHGNFQPYLCVSFILSLFGVFPSQT